MIKSSYEESGLLLNSPHLPKEAIVPTDPAGALPDLPAGLRPGGAI
ncbi:MAG TPA: hypothetical protein VNA65_00020 [Candidatus Dormibacteraeota bacterium]|nr:hypothetical protein [Candidatus Dormibacteraeota bacterium]